MRNRLYAAAFIALALSLLWCAGSYAKEKSAIGNVTVARGETVTNASAIRGNVDVYGHVTGNAVALMGNVHVHEGGVVDGDALAEMGKVVKDPGGIVKGSTSAKSARHGPAKRVGGDVVIAKGETVSEAHVVQGDLIIYGHVTGDANAAMGNIYVKPGGRIDGDANAAMGKVVQEPGGSVGGDVNSVDFPIPHWWRHHGTRWFTTGTDGFVARLPWLGLDLVVVALLSAIVVAIFPTRMQNVAAAVIQKPGWSLLYGAVGLLVLIPLAVLLAITCVGLLLIPVEFVLAVLLWIAGAIAVKLAIGLKLGEATGRPFRSLIWAAVVGSIIASLIKWIPIAGCIISFVLVVFGFGAVIMTGFGASPDWFSKRFDRTATPAPTPTPTPPPPP